MNRRSQGTQLPRQASNPLPADAQTQVSAFELDANAIRQKAEQYLQSRRELLITTLQTLQDCSQHENSPRIGIRGLLVESSAMPFQRNDSCRG